MKSEITHISNLISDRFDAQFRLGINNCIGTIKEIPHKAIGEFAQFSSESWDQKTIFTEFFPYIEIGSINTTTGDIDNIDLVRIKDAPSRAKKIVRENDILISTTRPNRGAICLYKKKSVCIASTGFSIIRKIDDTVLRDFLFIMLKLPLSLDQMMKRSSGGNYPAIIESELKKIIIPIPSKNIQYSIVDIYSKAQQTRSNKIQEAKQLLDGIDDFLFSKLDISLESNEFNSKGHHIKISDLIGGRLDVGYYNQSKHGGVTTALKSSKYPTAHLSLLTKDIFQGVGKNETDDNTYTLLKVKNILRGNRIDYSDVEYVKSVPKNKILLKDDIISPFIGEAVKQIKFCVFNREGNYTVDNNTGVIRLKDTMNAHYVCEYLCSCLGKQQIERLIGGGGVPFLGASGAKKLIIIIPPIKIQNEIDQEIANIRKKAETLIREGNTLLEETKKQIEKMIIG